jgi:hypothetical protein
VPYPSNAASSIRPPSPAAELGTIVTAVPRLPKGLQAPLTDDLRQYVPDFEVTDEEAEGAAIERLLLKQNYLEYITRNRHGADIPAGALCGVYRTPRGHIRVNIAAKYLAGSAKTLGLLSLNEGNSVIPYTFEGAWYFKGYENRERINAIYKKRMSLKYFRGCTAF